MNETITCTGAYAFKFQFYSLINDQLIISVQQRKNKLDRATMRPGCIAVCIEFGAKYVTYVHRQMDEKTDEVTE